ncbi:zinc finger protein [Fusarium mundagurra]|uniref:Zinc finger protein n=1 Tax=Fusarium mundagurra TaxID=1567541 RepID=A0A8H5Y2L2_9HYPO|nr:zinc finger protein [Fusarium mundagurra]
MLASFSVRIALGLSFRLPRPLTARAERTPTHDTLLISAHGASLLTVKSVDFGGGKDMAAQPISQETAMFIGCIISPIFPPDPLVSNSRLSFASVHGSMNSAYHRDRPGDQGRGNASYSSIDRSRNCDLLSFGRLHNTFRFQSAADIQGDTLKKKLDHTQPLEKPPARSFLSSPVNGFLSQRPPVEERFLAAQFPIRSGGNPGSLARTTETSIHSALYPRSTSFYYGDRPPNGSSYIDRLPRTRIKGNSCDNAIPTHSSYDFTGAGGMDMEDGQSLKRLHNDDAYVPSGQKRRATCPDDGYMFYLPSDPAWGRDSSSHGILPSVPTSWSMDPTSIATANSFGRGSPVGPSTGGISPTSCISPYTAPVSLDPNPQTSISSCKSIHPETTPGVSTAQSIGLQMPNATKVKGFFTCECCTRLKKLFPTIEELSDHKTGKQYKCLFCGARFKRSYEAMRHAKSFHVRSHSWSCSALSEYDNAFHDSTTKPGEADICGYCGDEFLRSGRGPGPGALSSGNPPRHATDQDWDERTRHLEKVHKFRECDSSKKFFRADHFRQHVKHSHAGTLGKWTNMLENACMLEEDKETK